MTIKQPTTITRSISETKHQLPKLVALIQDHEVRVIVTRWGKPQVMLVLMDLPPTMEGPIVAVIPYARSAEQPKPAPLGGPGWVSIKAAAQQLGLARTTVLYRIKRDELEARQLTEHHLKPWVVKLADDDQTRT